MILTQAMLRPMCCRNDIAKIVTVFWERSVLTDSCIQDDLKQQNAFCQKASLISVLLLASLLVCLQHFDIDSATLGKASCLQKIPVQPSSTFRDSENDCISQADL